MLRSCINMYRLLLVLHPPHRRTLRKFHLSSAENCAIQEARILERLLLTAGIARSGHHRVLTLFEPGTPLLASPFSRADSGTKDGLDFVPSQFRETHKLEDPSLPIVISGRSEGEDLDPVRLCSL